VESLGVSEPRMSSTRNRRETGTRSRRAIRPEIVTVA
jgi:hypothetical protein